MPDRAPPEHDPSTTPPGPESGRWDEATEHLWKTLQGINEWTRFADAKAAAVLTANGVMATIAAGANEKLWAVLAAHRMAQGLTLLCGLALIGSSILCVKCLFPRVRVKGEFRSLLFFHHIAQLDDPQTYLKRAGALGEPDVAFREVGTQVWAIAKVAREKHREVAWAIALTAASLILAIAAWAVAFLGR